MCHVLVKAKDMRRHMRHCVFGVKPPSGALLLELGLATLPARLLTHNVCTVCTCDLTEVLFVLADERGSQGPGDAAGRSQTGDTHTGQYYSILSTQYTQNLTILDTLTGEYPSQYSNPHNTIPVLLTGNTHTGEYCSILNTQSVTLSDTHTGEYPSQYSNP